MWNVLRSALRIGCQASIIVTVFHARPTVASPQAKPRSLAPLELETSERAQGAWSAAIDDIDQFLEANPDNIQALLDRAESERALGCADEARGNAAEVLALDPGNQRAAILWAAARTPAAGPVSAVPAVANDETWENYALRELCAKRPETAVEAFSRALSLGRRRADVLNDRGSALIGLHRYADAIADLDAALAKRSRYGAAYENRALAHFRLGNMDRAAADIDMAIAVLPRMAVAYGVRGNIRLARHDVARALADFRKEVQLRPDRANGHIDLGRAQQESGDRAAAAESYTAAIQAEPDDATAWEFRASIWFGQGDHGRATAEYARAAQLAPANPDILSQYAGSLRVDRRYDEALTVFDKALAIKPELYDARIGRSLTFEALNLFRADLADLDIAIGGGTAAAADYARRGWTRWQAGRPVAECESDYRHAIAMHPESAEFHQNFGWYLFSTRRYAEATREFDDAIRSNPSLEKAYRQRGMAWQALGDRIKARADYSRAIQIKPDYIWALLSRGLLNLLEKRPDEARADLDAAMRVDRLNAQVLLAHGFMTAARHDLAAAANDAVALSHKSPDWEGLDLLRANILLAGGALQLEAAELDHALAARKGDQPVLLVSRALVRERLGDKEGALSDVTLAERKSPTALEVVRIRERLLEQLGRFGEARDELDAIRARSPRDLDLSWKRATLDWRLRQIGAMVGDFIASL